MNLKTETYALTTYRSNMKMTKRRRIVRIKILKNEDCTWISLSWHKARWGCGELLSITSQIFDEYVRNRVHSSLFMNRIKPSSRHESSGISVWLSHVVFNNDAFSDIAICSQLNLSISNKYNLLSFLSMWFVTFDWICFTSDSLNKNFYFFKNSPHHIVHDLFKRND